MIRRAREFYAEMDQRRSVRQFATDPVSGELIALAIAAASTAPSGAHRQPWRFVAVSDAAIKRRLRFGAEQEEREFYEGARAAAEWHEALEPLGTRWEKSFLEIAPWVVVVFAELQQVTADGSTRRNYYVKESVGLACGLFVAAVHRMGLATLTYTPSRMQFLTALLGRPKGEKPYLVLPVGYPAVDAEVPNLRRKPLAEVATWLPPHQTLG